MNFSRLVSEWAWRVNDGLPDPKNRTHVEFLRDVLRESGYGEDFIMSYTQNLTEAEKFRAKSKETGDIVVYKSKENMEKAIEDGRADALDSDDKKNSKEEPAKDPTKLSAKDGDFERSTDDDSSKDDVETKTKGSTQKITREQSKNEQSKNDMLSDVASLIVHTNPDKKTGPGTHTLNKEDVEIYQKYLAKTPEEQTQVVDDIRTEREEKYGPISEEDIDITIELLREQLGSEEFNKLKSKIKGKGDPPSNMKKGDVGAERFRNVIRNYLETGGISPITGEVVPFSESQLDHVVSLDNGGQDRPENWMWMESRFNQFKGSKTDPEVKADLEELGFRTDKEWQLSASETELDAFNKASAESFWKKQFEKNGKSTGLTENTLNNLNHNEVNSVAKSWNNSLGNTNAERENHPDFISRYPARSVKLKVNGKEISLSITRGGNIKPVEDNPETYGLIQNPDTKEITKNPAYKGLSDEEAYKKSLDDYGKARGSGGKLKTKDELINDLIAKGIVSKSSDSKLEDSAIQKQLDEMQSRADEKQQSIDKLKDKIKLNPKTARAKKKIVDKAIKQYKKDNPKPTTGKKSKEVKAWNDKKNDFELEQWLKFKGEN